MGTYMFYPSPETFDSRILLRVKITDGSATISSNHKPRLTWPTMLHSQPPETFLEHFLSPSPTVYPIVFLQAWLTPLLGWYSHERQQTQLEGARVALA